MADVAELTKICLACGLCCNGSLFTNGKLRPEEVEPARKNRLVVIDEGDEGPLFEQPCARFDADAKACTIYEERPHTCRGFECRLLARFRAEGGQLESVLLEVRRAQELFARLKELGMDLTPGKPRSISASGADAFEVMGLVTELMERLERDFGRASDESA